MIQGDDGSLGGSQLSATGGSQLSASNLQATQKVRKRAKLRDHEDTGGSTGGGARGPKLPVPGDHLFGFRLRKELGRGAFACVFLAEQADLAGRPVVLKVSAIDGDEPQTLAQLQHTHIVPIYSVHEDPSSGLRAVCMPYFGGAALSQVLQVMWRETTRPTQGAQLIKALEAVASPAPGPASFRKKTDVLSNDSHRSRGPRPLFPDEAPGETPPPAPDPVPVFTLDSGSPTAVDLLRGYDYVRAAAWLIARLAEALQHAHQRGVIHRDIKPSNILFCSDGQPMLLDFNVSERVETNQAKAVLGGTVAYMAPEHLQAMMAKDARAVTRTDHRADIYPLGMVLYEMLAGTRPFDETGSYSPAAPQLVAMAMERSQTIPSLRQRRLDVPWSLESIARKCMTPDPAQRYLRAEHLAEDLRRFLDDLPLKYAPELSRRERVAKWLRRHPRVTSSGTVATAAAALLLTAGVTLVGVQDHLARAQEEIAVSQVQDRRRDFEAGTVRALCLVNTTAEVGDRLRQGAEACEQTLALFGVLGNDAWQRHPDWRRLAESDQTRLAEDVRELLQLLAWARVRLANGAPEALHEALALLDRAEAVAGLAPVRALWEDRAAYRAALGDEDGAREARARAGAIPPATARDHYLLATAFARAGNYSQAVTELDMALSLNPRHYWALVQRGICQQELGKTALALADFGVCIGLAPEFAWGYFNRGYVLEKSGNKQEAVRDYTLALDRDPHFLLAYLNRGMIRLDLRRYAEALDDLRQAARLGHDDGALHVGLGVALDGLGRPQEADEAYRAGLDKAAQETKATRIRLLWIYGMAVWERQPARARQAFNEVLRLAPDHPQALYGLGMILVEEGREAEALALYNRALAASPQDYPLHRYRAILLARAGKIAEAQLDVNWCLERHPGDGSSFYAAACVAAHAVDRYPDQATASAVARQALDFLAKALAQGYGRDQVAEDPDLKSLHKYPRFRELTK